MFLADFTWIRRQEYRMPYQVCTHFAKDICEKATREGMRSAIVILTFDETAHAINAFDTDYGLIFIEPQSGDQHKIEIGSSYPVSAGVSGEDNIIRSFKLLWNDDLSLSFLKCLDCGYVLPVSGITDLCLECRSLNTRLCKLLDDV